MHSQTNKLICISFLSASICLILGSKVLEYRIQNGYTANVGDFPSVVLLIGKTHRCTGTLIAPDKILTAGHCACGDAMKKAYANITDLDQRETSFVQVRPIIQVAYPISYENSCDKLAQGNTENHNELGGASDIAVLTVEKPFELHPGFVEIAPMDLNRELVDQHQILREQNDAHAVVLGFGKDPNSHTTGMLRYGFVALSECPTDIPIRTKGAMCSNIDINYQTPEVGDSGGPLIEYSGRVIGVTSIAGSGWTVFPSVANHAKFIRTQLK
ncbi:hypothetical protein EG68_09043 [Paragonimus skrjabini miyazakii]|uniref:Peptidase S1 domain-containing protein n=1 Tax=Paragonimus skrjabini miyazakii TaxID=59628 RepID=A0A8S9YC62_9TREM|nr:hypothetical protein EG68_09043 [Paragonimus skrjabini miyazakii]